MKIRYRSNNFTTPDEVITHSLPYASDMSNLVIYRVDHRSVLSYFQEHLIIVELIFE